MRASANATRRVGGFVAGLCLLFTLGLVGCDDYLSTEPKGELTSGNFFKTREHAIQATNATYSILRQWEVHVFAFIGQTDIASDDATKGSIPGDAGFLGELDDLNFDAGNLNAFRTTWVGYYQGVYRANVALEGIPRVSMDEALKARLIGENKFLRAYFYFFLVRAHGGVPLITAPLRPGEFMQPRATAGEIYDLIEQDLLDAIEVLPESYPPEDFGRATSGAAHGLLAKVYLFQQDYANALQHAEAAINSGEYALFSDYETLFTPEGENSSEAVFEVQAAVQPGSGCQPWQGCSNTQYAQVQGVRGTPNIGWGFNTPSFELEAAYEPGDPRLNATILYPWEMIPDGSGRVVFLNTAMPNPRFNQKVFVSPDNPGGTFNAGTNIRRLRYADVLLIAAEAAYQTGSGMAATYLNMVRERARGGQTVTLGFTHEELAPSIQSVLGLTGSRVFVRYVNPGSPAATAELQGLATGRDDAVDPPIHVDNLDIISTVDGVAVTTPADYLAEMSGKNAGQNVVLGVTRVTQDEGGAVSTLNLSITIAAQPLLPDVTATGQALLEAIWQERRVELAMEHHRFFDIRRQEAVSPGRAAELFAAHGKTWQPHLMLSPIPLTEVQIAGLEQNPGY